MKKSCVWQFISLLTVSTVVSASYGGPFLLWGMENLKAMKIPSLQGKKAFEILKII
jgi:hypothetical protein